MIPIEKERRALRLLAAGRLTERKIARAVGISRGTVWRLKRLGQERPRPARNGTMLEARRPGPIERCPGCGRMIEMPCWACNIEGHRRSRARKFPTTPASVADLAPDLDDEDHARMELVRAAKIAALAASRPPDDNGRPAPIEERQIPDESFAEDSDEE